jgi:hypothetical protein
MRMGTLGPPSGVTSIPYWKVADPAGERGAGFRV